MQTFPGTLSPAHLPLPLDERDEQFLHRVSVPVARPCGPYQMADGVIAWKGLPASHRLFPSVAQSDPVQSMRVRNPYPHSSPTMSSPTMTVH